MQLTFSVLSEPIHITFCCAVRLCKPDLSTRSLCAGYLKEGCELINEALNLFNNVYGAMHVEICACLRLLARLNYIMGDHHEVCCSRHDTHTFIFLSHMKTNGHSNSSDSPDFRLLCPQALSNQQKAVLMSERVLGVEHPNTIQEYVCIENSLFRHLKKNVSPC